MGTRAQGRPRPEPRGGRSRPSPSSVVPAVAGTAPARQLSLRGAWAAAAPRAPRASRGGGAAARPGPLAQLAVRAREERGVWKVVEKLLRREGGGEWGCRREKPASSEFSEEEGGKGAEFRFLNGCGERRWALGRPAGRALRPQRIGASAMAVERTRRFTRSLLRPGQAAELRHSAASAAAVAVSTRQQQRVSAARPPRLPARPGWPGTPSRASAAPRAPCLCRSSLPSPARLPPPPLLARVPGATSARQCHRRVRTGRVWGPGTFGGAAAQAAEAQRGRGCVWVRGGGEVAGLHRRGDRLWVPGTQGVGESTGPNLSVHSSAHPPSAQ